MEEVKQILGVEGDDVVLTFLHRSVERAVLDYCRREDMPEGLLRIVDLMTIKLYKSWDHGGIIKSINQGDTKLEYYDKDGDICDIVRDFSAMLGGYRKL